MSPVAERLRIARENAGLTQGQAARLMKLHRPTISEVEAGRRRVTSDELTAFATIYDVSVAWLTGTEEEDLEARVMLAARQLAKLKPQDLDVMLRLLTTMKRAKKQSSR
jgi:transcriptional regulator with XRE-family HTH domain